MRVPLPYLLMVETLYLWPVRINLEPIMEKTEVVKEAVTFFMPKKLEILGTDLLTFPDMSTVEIGSPNHLYLQMEKPFIL